MIMRYPEYNIIFTGIIEKCGDQRKVPGLEYWERKKFAGRTKGHSSWIRRETANSAVRKRNSKEESSARGKVRQQQGRRMFPPAGPIVDERKGLKGGAIGVCLFATGVELPQGQVRRTGVQRGWLGGDNYPPIHMSRSSPSGARGQHAALPPHGCITDQIPVSTKASKRRTGGLGTKEKVPSRNTTQTPVDRDYC